MEPIEERLRTSLRTRAGDVEATPHLWQEVDRRIHRRQRRTAWSWVTVGVAAAIAAVVIVPGLLPDASAPEVADRPPGIGETEQPPATDGSGEPTTDDGTGAPGETEGPGGAGTGALLVGAGREVRVLAPDGETAASYAFPEEGGSTVTGLAVRPGSDGSEMTAALITTAEGMYDLRILRLDGGDLTVEVVDDPTYRPGQGGGADLHVSGPVWAPDGTSLSWLEQDDSGARLRTVGWEDGPGSDDPTTDNATFALEAEAGASLELMDWVQLDDERFLLRAIAGTPRDSWYELALVRQADGAWAVAPDDGLERIAAPTTSDGPVLGLAGVIEPQDGTRVQPAWLVRQSAQGPVAVRQRPDGQPDTVALPPEVLGPADAAGPAWAVVLDDGVLISSPRTETAAVVDEDGQVRLLDGRAAYVSPIR